MRLARLAALVVLLVPVQASAFDWFGLKSGMTVDQVRTAAPAGSTLRVNGDFGFIEKQGAPVATVTFCRGRLIALSRTIDAQSDWFALADKMIKQYGKPTVTPASDPWAGPTASVSKGLELSWRSGRNKYALTSYPPAPPGPGPRAAPAKTLASLSVADLGPVNACVAKREVVHPQVRKASFVRRAKRARRPQRKLPPIGGARLELLPAAVQRVQAQAGAATQPPAASREAAHLNTAEQEAQQVDPASVRGRILRFFGLVRERVSTRPSVDDK